MDPAQLQDRRRRRQALLAALVLAVIAAAASYYVLTRPGAGEPSTTPQPLTIVVAAQDIPARTKITADMLTTTQVPNNPAFAHADTDPTLAVGKIAVVDISQGQPIESSLYGAGTVGGLTILNPDETISPESPIWRAVSVQAPADRAVGGLLKQGDHIDLYVTLNPQIYDPNGEAGGYTDPNHPPASTGAYYSDMTTKLVWSDLEILSVNTDKNLYVLKVDEAQAEEIAHVQSTNAQFTIGLRPPADTRDVDATQMGQTTSELMQKYGFPIPVEITVPGASAPPLPSLTPVPASPSPAPGESPSPEASPTP